MALSRDPYELRNTSALALVLSLLGTIAFFVAFSTAAGDAARECSWCESNAVDLALRNALYAENSLAAAKLSHAMTMIVTPALAIAIAVVPGIRTSARSHGRHNGMILLIGFLLTTAVCDGVKKLVSRERPGFHLGRGSLIEAAQNPLERHLSFFSGDTAWAFFFVAAALTIAHFRGYHVPRWLAAVAVSAATLGGLLRICADMHWASDVLAGALVGAAIGVGLPLALHRRIEA